MRCVILFESKYIELLEIHRCPSAIGFPLTAIHFLSIVIDFVPVEIPLQLTEIDFIAGVSSFALPETSI